jgi:DHA2 family methylenomycin A resistance protein-like MFS transporter
VGTRIGAKILRIHGPFGPLVGGHLVAGLGALLLASLALRFGPFVLIAPLTVVGFAAGITTPAMSLAVLDSVSRNQGGLASGILNSARQVGGVIGVAVLGASLGEPASISGAHTAEFIAAASLVLASIVAFFALRSRAHQD